MDDARRRRFSFARSEASSPSRLRRPSRSSAYILYLICTGPRNKEEKKRAGPRGPRGDRRKEKASSGISSRAMKRKGRKPSLKQKTPYAPLIRASDRSSVETCVCSPLEVKWERKTRWKRLESERRSGAKGSTASLPSKKRPFGETSAGRDLLVRGLWKCLPLLQVLRDDRMR